MTRRDKLLKRMRTNPRHVTMRDLQTVLESFGFELDRIAGSHYVFAGRAGDDQVTLVIPLRRPHVKAGYVKDTPMVIDRILPDEEQTNEDQDS